MTSDTKEHGEDMLIARITEYLSTGGLFNPELMDHKQVSALLWDCRNELRQRPTPERPPHQGITQEMREAMEIVNEQAEDEGLWFEAEYITESVLQAALRRLHAALESAASATSGRAASAAKVETCTRVASYAGENAAPGVKQKVDRT